VEIPLWLTKSIFKDLLFPKKLRTEITEIKAKFNDYDFMQKNIFRPPLIQNPEERGNNNFKYF
jgi:hypothetical protein